MSQKILIIGSGGREHALAWKLAQSPHVGEIFVAPGNGGTPNNVPLSAENLPGLISFAHEQAIDLTIVGPEVPLADGIVNDFQSEGLKIFGPVQEAAELEASKAFAKKFMRNHHIPTAHHGTFTAYHHAAEFVREFDKPVVVKASGLAAGKGVIVCDTTDEALLALHQMFEQKAFGSAGETVVVEERLTGREFSVLAFCDGKTALTMPIARDYKRALDGGHGLNTGGMGAYAPTDDITPALVDEVRQRVIQPVLDGMAQRGTPYVGVLYAGLMLTPTGIQVLEFNCRFGDPETQVLLPLLASDLYEVLMACIEGRLSEVQWHTGACATVVLASEGYPQTYATGLPINGLETLATWHDVVVFHAGTTRNMEDDLLTAGGRVLNITARGADVPSAIRRAYEAVAHVHFEGMHFRHDIGEFNEM